VRGGGRGGGGGGVGGGGFFWHLEMHSPKKRVAFHGGKGFPAGGGLGNSFGFDDEKKNEFRGGTPGKARLESRRGFIRTWDGGGTVL